MRADQAEQEKPPQPLDPLGERWREQAVLLGVPDRAAGEHDESEEDDEGRNLGQRVECLLPSAGLLVAHRRAAGTDFDMLADPDVLTIELVDLGHLAIGEPVRGDADVVVADSQEAGAVADQQGETGESQTGEQDADENASDGVQRAQWVPCLGLLHGRSLSIVDINDKR